MQLDLFGDYQSNVALYPTFQMYFRTCTPPFLAAWGKNDPFFLPQGAEAFQRDIPDAVVHFFDTGHFAPGDPRRGDCGGHPRLPSPLISQPGGDPRRAGGPPIDRRAESCASVGPTHRGFGESGRGSAMIFGDAERAPQDLHPCSSCALTRTSPEAHRVHRFESPASPRRNDHCQATISLPFRVASSGNVTKRPLQIYFPLSDRDCPGLVVLHNSLRTRTPQVRRRDGEREGGGGGAGAGETGAAGSPAPATSSHKPAWMPAAACGVPILAAGTDGSSGAAAQRQGAARHPGARLLRGFGLLRGC